MEKMEAVLNVEMRWKKLVDLNRAEKIKLSLYQNKTRYYKWAANVLTLLELAPNIDLLTCDSRLKLCQHSA